MLQVEKFKCKTEARAAREDCRKKQQAADHTGEYNQSVVEKKCVLVFAEMKDTLFSF